ncbi:C40 family peptidase [Lentilactobacillus sp. Marseille-Q4993]|uniref:C40 family peptidase n=1 Tax=Lentilactobacillus sp. Marseille-Q4993 TaxID=3039492 RepID=UPI0024BC2B19|nr:C40 family peptidase [Lentilactobacillus sp. Marseille-Q4993]
MKFKKSLLSLAFAGAVLGGSALTATSASADTYTNAQQTQAASYYANNGYNNYNNYATYQQSATTNGYTTTPTTQTTTTTTTTQSANNTTSSSSTSDSKAQAVVSLAKKLAGQNIPYVWGGESLSGMDCSGLTDYVYQKAANIKLGHYTVTQESHVTKKAVSAAKPGDLLFWGAQGATHHVAIYIGNNQFVAAPQPGQNVDIETINSAFMPSFAGHVNG